MSTISKDLLAICRAFAALERSAICCGPVSVQQCVVLNQLLDGPQDMGQLALASGASTSAMTRLVDGMERRGWVVRERDPGDRRRVSVALTDAGKDQAESLWSRTEEAIGAILAQIPEDRHQAIAEALGLIAEGVRRVYGDACSC